MVCIYSNHGHRVACSVMLELGCRAPIVIKWPAVVLVIWSYFNGNAQRRPFGVSAVFFADMAVSMHKPRAAKRKTKSAEGPPKNPCAGSVLFGGLPSGLPLAFFCNLFGVLACLPGGVVISVSCCAGKTPPPNRDGALPEGRTPRARRGEPR